jgi:NADH-quinone oxidoreductase subunit A
MHILLATFAAVLILIIVLLAVTYIANLSTYDYEKHAAYECGFEPFGDARGYFDIHFYVTGLLLVVFDLEVAFLVPFVIDITQTSLLAFSSFLVVFYLLVLGFFYE